LPRSVKGGGVNKIILDLCGGTGAWSKPYRDTGYDVRLVTLPDQDVRTYQPPDNVYGILAAPPCTMFSFARTREEKTKRDLRQGMETVEACLRIIWECQYRYARETHGYKTSLKFWALENPNGFLKHFIGNPVYTFDPYEFGDIYSKRTCIWGYFNNPVKTHVGKQTRLLNKKFDTLTMQEIRSIGDNIFKNTKTRQELRSITPAGFAKAFFEANR